jgi:hypothetical protein
VKVFTWSIRTSVKRSQQATLRRPPTVLYTGVVLYCILTRENCPTVLYTDAREVFVTPRYSCIAIPSTVDGEEPESWSCFAFEHRLVYVLSYVIAPISTGYVKLYDYTVCTEPATSKAVRQRSCYDSTSKSPLRAKSDRSVMCASRLSISHPFVCHKIQPFGFWANNKNE